MKKPVLSSLIIFSIIFAPTLKADGGDTSYNASTEQTDSSPGSSLLSKEPLIEEPSLAVEPEMEEFSEGQGTTVGQASTAGINAAKKKQWQNIAIAACAVAVAATALILVSTNEGHKKS